MLNKMYYYLDWNDPMPQTSIAATPPSTLPKVETGRNDETMLTRALRILGGEIREDDYLPMTEEVRQSLGLSEAYIRDVRKGDLVEEARREHIQYLLLTFHCGGRDIVSYQDEHGVAVLAVSHEIRDLLDALSPEQLLRVCLQSPELW